MDSEAREGEPRQPQIQIKPNLQRHLKHPDKDTPALIPLFQEVGLPVKATTYLAAIRDLPWGGDFSDWHDAYEELETKFWRRGSLSSNEESMIEDAASILAENLIMADVTYQNMPNSEVLKRMAKEPFWKESPPKVRIKLGVSGQSIYRPIQELPKVKGAIQEIADGLIERYKSPGYRGEVFSSDGLYYWAHIRRDEPEKDTWVKAALDVTNLPEEILVRLATGEDPASVLAEYSSRAGTEVYRKYGTSQEVRWATRDARWGALERWYRPVEESSDYDRLASEIAPHVKARVERLADEDYIDAGVSWAIFWENKLRIYISFWGDVGRDSRIKEDMPSDPQDRIIIRIEPILKPDRSPYTFDEYTEAGRKLKEALLSP